MNSTDYSYIPRSMALNEKTRRRYPRVLFLPFSAGDPDGGQTAMVRGLGAEGWKVTAESGVGAISEAPWDRLIRWPDVIGDQFGAARAMIRSIPKYDLIHVSCQSARQIFREGLPALVLARFFGKKVVLHFGSAETERLLEQKRKWLMPFLRLADSIVVGSRSLQKVFGRTGLEARLLVEPRLLEGIDHRLRTNLQPRILVNCALEPDMNTGCAIRAYQLVKQKYPRAELILVGDGSERLQLQNAAEQDSFCDVEFRAGMSLTETAELYNSCDLLLHTPLVDESPTSLVRAFAAGLPVVVTDADGLLHMVREGVSALIVAAGDHVAVADAIIELVENRELTEKLSRQGADEARKYTWSRVRQDWVNLYTELWG